MPTFGNVRFPPIADAAAYVRFGPKTDARQENPAFSRSPGSAARSAGAQEENRLVFQSGRDLALSRRARARRAHRFDALVGSRFPRAGSEPQSPTQSAGF